MFSTRRVKERLIRIAGGADVEPDATTGLAYPSADFKELEPDCPGLGGAQFGSLQMSAQQPEQAVGQGMKQEPELVGLEAMATEPVGFKIELQFLDAVFRLAPSSHRCHHRWFGRRSRDW